MASRLGISRRSKHIELKYLWIQDEVNQGRQIGAQEGRNSLQSIRCSHKVCSSFSSRSTSSSSQYLQGQFPKVKISSCFQQNQFTISSHPQPPSTSSITTTPLSVFMFSFINNYDHQEELRLRFRQASRSIKKNSHTSSSRERRSRRFKCSSVVIMSFIVI